MGITWRGGGFMDSADTRAFFTPDKVSRLQVCPLTRSIHSLTRFCRLLLVEPNHKRYRVPNFLASSFDKSVTTGFIRRYVVFARGCVYVLLCECEWL
jgi:hypothetical protein